MSERQGIGGRVPRARPAAAASRTTKQTTAAASGNEAAASPSKASAKKSPKKAAKKVTQKPAGKSAPKKAAQQGQKRAAKTTAKTDAAKPSSKTAAKAAAKDTAKEAPKTAPKTKRAAKKADGASVNGFAAIRTSLERRQVELRDEYERATADLNDLQRDRLGDSAGDDQADVGTKTFEREQEISLTQGIFERLNQVEHALARLDAGTYGRCERCGNPIPKARLEAFPSVTLCVSCKQREERR